MQTHKRGKQSFYNGCLFRSTLEARWAIFFDKLKIRYHYEPEGYHLPSGDYLPDFYLPDSDLFVEIKSTEPTHSEKIKMYELSCISGKVCAIFYGAVGFNEEKEESDFNVWATAGDGYAISEYDYNGNKKPTEQLNTIELWETYMFNDALATLGGETGEWLRNQYFEYLSAINCKEVKCELPDGYFNMSTPESFKYWIDVTKKHHIEAAKNAGGKSAVHVYGYSSGENRDYYLTAVGCYEERDILAITDNSGITSYIGADTIEALQYAGSVDIDSFKGIISHSQCYGINNCTIDTANKYIIKTKWNGTIFNCRRDARWAVFLSALGIGYEYYPEGLPYEYEFGTENTEIYKGVFHFKLLANKEEYFGVLCDFYDVVNVPRTGYVIGLGGYPDMRAFYFTVKDNSGEVDWWMLYNAIYEDDFFRQAEDSGFVDNNGYITEEMTMGIDRYEGAVSAARSERFEFKVPRKKKNK